MYYNDETRRFNFVSGLVCGTMLGTGLALLLAPPKQVRRRRIHRATRSWKNRAQTGLEALRDSASAAVEASRRHSNAHRHEHSGR